MPDQPPDRVTAASSRLRPRPLTRGDRIRFVSPASPPDREDVLERAERLRARGFVVDFGDHVFDRTGYLAGSDSERLADVNAALRDPNVRAIVATRGGKGSYRIADRLDFAAAACDPKLLVGFSDITILLLSLWRHCGLPGIHGAFIGGDEPAIRAADEALLGLLTMPADRTFDADPQSPSFALTTHGTADGVLLGGNLDMIAAAAGWALPDLQGAILLVEIANVEIGHIDRQMTMLVRSGALNGVAGVAIGQILGFEGRKMDRVLDVVRGHLDGVAIAVLGGLPFGHGQGARPTMVGVPARLDASTARLTVFG